MRSLAGVAPDSQLVLAFMRRFMERGLAPADPSSSSSSSEGRNIISSSKVGAAGAVLAGEAAAPTADGEAQAGGTGRAASAASLDASAMSSAATTSPLTDSAPDLAAAAAGAAAAGAGPGPAVAAAGGGGTAVAAGPATGAGGSQRNAELAAALRALGLRIDAELGRGPAELRHLQARGAARLARPLLLTCLQHVLRALA